MSQLTCCFEMGEMQMRRRGSLHVGCSRVGLSVTSELFLGIDSLLQRLAVLAVGLLNAESGN